MAPQDSSCFAALVNQTPFPSSSSTCILTKGRELMLYEKLNDHYAKLPNDDFNEEFGTQSAVM